MRVVVLAVGRMKQGPERELLNRYADRARASARAVGLTGFEIRDIEESRARQTSDRKGQEARALLDEIVPGSIVVALDERGRSLGSEAFAEHLGRARDAGAPAYALVIGGADGLDDLVRTRADLCLSYGAATFPHQIVRILAVEQVYRAITILSGHPYHRA